MTNTENEKRFFNMLSEAPELKQYWDEKEGMAKIKSIQIAISRNNKEHGALLSFFGSVWFGNSDMFKFDFIKAVQNMNDRDKRIIRRWLVAPFFCGDWA